MHQIKWFLFFCWSHCCSDCMSTENGSAAHKGIYINGLKTCFQHGLKESGRPNQGWFRKYGLFRKRKDLSVDQTWFWSQKWVSWSQPVSQSLVLSTCPLSINLFLSITMMFSWSYMSILRYHHIQRKHTVPNSSQASFKYILLLSQADFTGSNYHLSPSKSRLLAQMRHLVIWT